MSSGTIISLFIGSVVSGVVTWLVSWSYYKRAADELSHETGELKELVIGMLVGMERQGWVDLDRDKAGSIIGWKLRGIASITLDPMTATATGEVRDRTSESEQ